MLCRVGICLPLLLKYAFCFLFNHLGVKIGSYRPAQCMAHVHCHTVKKQPFENMVSISLSLCLCPSLSGSWQIVGGGNGKAPAPVPLVHHANVKGTIHVTAVCCHDQAALP